MRDQYYKKRWDISDALDRVIDKIMKSESPDAEKEEQLANRKISLNGRQLLNQVKKQHIVFEFKVREVKGLKAYTKFVGHEVKGAYLKRLIKRRTSKVEVNQVVTTKDNEKAKVKTVVITAIKATTRQRNSVRKTVAKRIEETANKKGFEDLVQEMIFGSTISKIFNEAKKIVPIKRIEVIKAALIEGK